jgi:hypothetical protein
VQVIERRSPDPGSSRLALAATLPAVTWNLLVTLSGAQRVSWIIWSWILAAAVLLFNARRDSKKEARERQQPMPMKREGADFV